jgi:two-component system response regulator BaeR
MSGHAGDAARPRRVLVVEDDAKIASLLVDYLRSGGFAAESVGDGLAAVERVRAAAPDAVLLDLMLPGLDGLGVCRALRGFSAVPIMMITARIDEIDRLLGLETGADDYVCKPFSPREVVARVRALLRRAEGRFDAARTAPPWAVDAGAQRIRWRDAVLPLTPVEYRLLARLLAHPGRVFARAQLLDAMHDTFHDVSDRAIDSHVKNLRRKLDAVEPGVEVIASVYGVGYRFEWPA